MISVLVVDDSVVVRRLITDALADDPGIRVVGTAPNGKIALTKIDQLSPDLITLDIEMPVMNGLETLRALRPKYRRLPVIMFSTLTAAGATATLDALAAGASDYVTKPANVGSVGESIRSVREQIIPKIYALCAPRGATPVRFGRQGLPTLPGRSPRTSAGPVSRSSTMPAPYGNAKPLLLPGSVRTAPPLTARSRSERVDVIAIGASTGGPDALSRVLKALPATLPVPIVVVQHMPPVFTKMFAERLDRVSQVHVVEAQSNMVVRPGTVYLAAGDYHMEIVRRGSEVVIRLQSGPPENFCRPSVDVLYRSVAKVYGGATLGVVLTGMGQDGRRGSEALRAVGAEITAQDEPSSVVWGMPGSVVQAGLAHTVLPLDDIANHLIARATGGRGARFMEVTR